VKMGDEFMQRFQINRIVSAFFAATGFVITLLFNSAGLTQPEYLSFEIARCSNVASAFARLTCFDYWGGNKPTNSKDLRTIWSIRESELVGTGPYNLFVSTPSAWAHTTGMINRGASASLLLRCFGEKVELLIAFVPRGLNYRDSIIQIAFEDGQFVPARFSSLKESHGGILQDAAAMTFIRTLEQHHRMMVTFRADNVEGTAEFFLNGLADHTPRILKACQAS
jgi:hypothetical protein